MLSLASVAADAATRLDGIDAIPFSDLATWQAIAEGLGAALDAAVDGEIELLESELELVRHLLGASGEPLH